MPTYWSKSLIPTLRELPAETLTGLATLEVGLQLVPARPGQFAVQVLRQFRQHFAAPHPGDFPFNGHGALPGNWTRNAAVPGAGGS